MPVNIVRALELWGSLAARESGALTPEETACIEGFQKLVLAVATAQEKDDRDVRGCGSGDPSRVAPEDVRDLAGDFTLYLIQERPRSLPTAASLKREYVSWLTKRRHPAQQEAWLVLSQALHQLARDGGCHRLTGARDDRNTNDTVWCWAGCEQGTLDELALRAACSRLAAYSPRRTAGRALTDGQARDLAERLLQAAAAPITMRLLFDLARTKVFMLRGTDSINRPSEGPDTGAMGRDPPDRGSPLMAEAWLLAQARAVARQVWGALGPDSRQVLCRYTLPDVLGHLVTQDALPDVGRKSKVSTLNQRVEAALGQALQAHLAPADDDATAAVVAAVWSLVLAELVRRCTEMGCDGSLYASSAPHRAPESSSPPSGVAP